ncbi:MAG: TauD/TfdA family dioxygenase, partial [Amphiplicatus sp.]
MRLTPIADNSVWRGADLARDPSWSIALTAAHRAEALTALAETNARDIPLEEIDPDVFVLPTLGRVLEGVIDEIEGGRGVALLQDVPIEGLSLLDTERLFWGLASHIGFAEMQDISGKRLHHVRAEQTFASAAKAADAFTTSTVRGYQTNIELTFHGDGSDALFFLCRRAAKAGGMSRVASATAAFNAVLSRDPSLAAALQTPFAF